MASTAHNACNRQSSRIEAQADCQFVIRPATDGDAEAIVEVFNYFIEHTFAAFPERPVPLSFYRRIKRITAGYPLYIIESVNGECAGFGLLRPYDEAESFSGVGEMAYFIMPEFIGHGLGSRILNQLETDARELLGLESLLICISSLNKESLDFHVRKGFIECGRFRRIGCKHGQRFDAVWMQKFLI